MPLNFVDLFLPNAVALSKVSPTGSSIRLPRRFVTAPKTTPSVERDCGHETKDRQRIQGRENLKHDDEKTLKRVQIEKQDEM
jgi:hypothetical protein